MNPRDLAYFLEQTSKTKTVCKVVDFQKCHWWKSPSNQWLRCTTSKGSWNLPKLDVSRIIEKFNVYVTLAIIPRTKDIHKAFWLVHIFIETLSFLLLGRRISLLYAVYWKNLALLQYHIYSGNVYYQRCIKMINLVGHFDIIFCDIWGECYTLQNFDEKSIWFIMHLKLKSTPWENSPQDLPEWCHVTDYMTRCILTGQN